MLCLDKAGSCQLRVSLTDDFQLLLSLKVELQIFKKFYPGKNCTKTFFENFNRNFVIIMQNSSELII